MWWRWKQMRCTAHIIIEETNKLKMTFAVIQLRTSQNNIIQIRQLLFVFEWIAVGTTVGSCINASFTQCNAKFGQNTLRPNDAHIELDKIGIDCLDQLVRFIQSVCSPSCWHSSRFTHATTTGDGGMANAASVIVYCWRCIAIECSVASRRHWKRE